MYRKILTWKISKRNCSAKLYICMGPIQTVNIWLPRFTNVFWCHWKPLIYTIYVRKEKNTVWKYIKSNKNSLIQLPFATCGPGRVHFFFFYTLCSTFVVVSARCNVQPSQSYATVFSKNEHVRKTYFVAGLCLHQYLISKQLLTLQIHLHRTALYDCTSWPVKRNASTNTTSGAVKVKRQPIFGKTEWKTFKDKRFSMQKQFHKGEWNYVSLSQLERALVGFHGWFTTILYQICPYTQFLLKLL